MYDFSQVTSHEFEKVCQDLLEEELGVSFEVFGPGPDGGVDLRHLASTASPKATIVQCKNYAKTPYATLLSHLRRDESPKVRALAPDRYILMTSVSLTPHRKTEIQDVFSPAISTPADVYGADEIDGLLRKHGGVARRHIKLWLTSTEVLDAVVNSDIANRAEGFVEHLQRQLRMWVPNASFHRATQVLSKNRVCLLVGPPGVGKTILADVIVAALVGQGFEPVIVSEDINEGDRAWRSDRRQVFLYDDFLGRVTLGELSLRKNEDNRLAAFIRRVRENPRKRLVLTTREYILAEARGRSETLDATTTEVLMSTVSLADYTPMIRAQILYNHLYFSDLPPAARLSLLPGRQYRAVIAHRNYSPRTIEHVVDLFGPGSQPHDDFPKAMLAALENPAQLWARIFDNLPPLGRHVLLTLATLPARVMLDDVRQATRALSAEATDASSINRALRTLDGTFVSTSKIRLRGAGEANHAVSFRDASIKDFIWQHLRENPDEADRLLENAVFFEQVSSLAARGEGGITRAQAGTSKLHDPEHVVGKGVELLDSPSCRLISYDGAFGGQWADRYHAWREARLAQLVDLAESNSAAQQAVLPSLEATLDKWARGQGRKAEAVTLIRVLRESDVDRAAVLQAEQATYDWCTGTLDSLDDFEELVRLGRICPERFTDPDRTLTSFGKELLECVEEEKEYWPDYETPEELDEVGTQLRQLSAVLDVDVGEAMDAVSELQLGLEEDRDSEPEPDDDWREASSGTESSDAAIDLLFESLRQADI